MARADALVRSASMTTLEPGQEPIGTQMPIPDQITEAANAVAESLDAAVYVYRGDINVDGYGLLLGAIQPSDEQPERPNSILFMTTLGGDAGAAYRIARLLQNISEKLYLCVPTVCKSAGTLIALGANAIYMSPMSELGPLDVQLKRQDEIDQRRSGMVVRTALDGLAEETFEIFQYVMFNIKITSENTISYDVASRIASEIAIGVMKPVYAQINPETLGQDIRDLSVATVYGELLVEQGGNATPETVRQLVEDYPTHGFIIDSKEAKQLFENVDELTPEMEELILALGNVAYSVQFPHVIQRVDRHSRYEEKNDGD